MIETFSVTRNINEFEIIPIIIQTNTAMLYINYSPSFRELFKTIYEQEQLSLFRPFLPWVVMTGHISVFEQHTNNEMLHPLFMFIIRCTGVSR